MKRSSLNPVSNSSTSKNRRNQDAKSRKALKTISPFCEICLSEEHETPATQLHHVRTKGAARKFRQNPANHLAVCDRHHDHNEMPEIQRWFLKHRPEDAEIIELRDSMILRGLDTGDES